MSKLNDLYAKLRPGSPVTSEELAALGVSADLAVHYVRARWLTRLGRGVFARPDLPLELHPSLRLLERRLKGLHVGGKSARLARRSAQRRPAAETPALRVGIQLIAFLVHRTFPE